MAYFLLVPREPLDELWREAEYDNIVGVYADDESEARELTAGAFAATDPRLWQDPYFSICRKAAMLGVQPSQSYKGVHMRLEKLR